MMSDYKFKLGLALAREAALREDLAKYKAGCVDLSSQVRELEHKMDYYKVEGMRADALQQRLTVAEQRAAFLERVMRDTLNDEDGLFITAEFNTGPTWSALQKHGRSIEAALKPAAEGENHG